MDLVKRNTKEYNFKSLKLDLSFIEDFVFGIAFIPKGTIFFQIIKWNNVPYDVYNYFDKFFDK